MKFNLEHIYWRIYEKQFSFSVIVTLSQFWGGVEAQTKEVPPYEMDSIGRYRARNCVGYAICRIYGQGYSSSSPKDEQYLCEDEFSHPYMPPTFFTKIAHGNTESSFFAALQAGKIVFFANQVHAVYVETKGSDTSSTKISEVAHEEGEFNEMISLHKMIIDHGFGSNWYDS